MHADFGTPTLFLRVTPSGSKQWVQRIFCQGKQISLGLGGVSYTTLDEAQRESHGNAQGNPHRLEPHSRTANSGQVCRRLRKPFKKSLHLHQGSWKNPKQKRQEWVKRLFRFMCCRRAWTYARGCDIEAERRAARNFTNLG